MPNLPSEEQIRAAYLSPPQPMAAILFNDVDDSAAFEDFQTTQADDQIGYLRLKNGAYGVMTRYTLLSHNYDKHTVLLGAIVDVATALRSISWIINFLDNIKPGQTIPDGLVGRADMLPCGKPMFAINLVRSNSWAHTVDEHIPLIPFRQTDPQVARPWRMDYRRSLDRWSGPSADAKRLCLVAAKNHWTTQYDRILGEATKPKAGPTPQQPHGHTHDEASI